MTNNDATVKPLTETEIAFLTERSRPVRLSKAGAQIVKMSCTRCGGSGSHSYCQMYGTMCFGCSGRGYNYVAARKAIARIKRSETAQRRLDRAATEAFLSHEAECYANEAAGLGYVSNAEVAQAAYKRQQEEAEAVRIAAQSVHITKHAVLIGRLLGASTQRGDFCSSLAEEICGGRDPREFSPRCKSIVIDILAKAFGRRNSKAYNEAVDELGDLLAA